jgi:ribosomal protein S18 acetylase RimI-like enzyme
VHLREATAADVDLLVDLLLEAVSWTGEARMTRQEVLADAHLVRYVEDWPRPGDLGLVAEVPSGTRSSPDAPAAVGAAWLRMLPAAAPGYGYVADDVPELSMAVAPGWRGRGIGTQLVAAVLDRARQRGDRAVSLSVEDGNDVARCLYERVGFRPVGRVGGSDTLLLTF